MCVYVVVGAVGVELAGSEILTFGPLSWRLLLSSASAIVALQAACMLFEDATYQWTRVQGFSCIILLGWQPETILS